MAAGVHCQRPPAGAGLSELPIALAGKYATIDTVLMCRHWAPAGGRCHWTSDSMATAGLNITTGVASAMDSNRANPIYPDFNELPLNHSIDLNLSRLKGHCI